MKIQTKLIAISMGDAAGVGPELCLRLLASEAHVDANGAVPVIIGSGDLLRRVSEATGLPFTTPVFHSLNEIKSSSSPCVYDPGILKASDVIPSQNQAVCGASAAEYIRIAANGCMNGTFAAMCTAPISKKALHMGGTYYPGHTEMLADIGHAPHYAMLLYSDKIACAFVTCHQSLQSVPASLTAARVVEVGLLAHHAIKKIKNTEPRFALLGLNPHAGEEGLFGSEESDVLLHAMETLRARGLNITTPLPPDTAFTPDALARYDCHLAMYHDQGSIPFKMLAFDEGVNVTMGLPFVRTSPDHGTAFNIAWKGIARPDSFFQAYDLAVKLG